MSQQISFRYSILKGYVQGEMDVLNIIDQIASSKQTKQVRANPNMRRSHHSSYNPIANMHMSRVSDSWLATSLILSN